MDIVNKQTRKYFYIGALISIIIALILYQWLAAIFIIWAILLLGGLVPPLKQFQKYYSFQWGCALGLTIALILLIFGPWELYTNVI